jgi:uncharacterized Zn finger protein (UPF0148 family)
MPRREACERCGGTGYLGLAVCPTCKGRGWLMATDLDEDDELAEEADDELDDDEDDEWDDEDDWLDDDDEWDIEDDDWADVDDEI